MGSELRISAVALSSKGKDMNLDNIYVNGRYLAPDSNEPDVCITKSSNVPLQMYGVCDGDNADGVVLKASPAVTVMQQTQQLQSILSMDGSVSRDKIWNYLCETNSRIRDLQRQAGSENLTSTFAGLFLCKDRGIVVHLGDSRVYVIRGGRMLQITEDHLEATDLYKLGVLSQEQAEVHKLSSKPTATLGMYDIYDVESQVFSKRFIFYPGDIFILCTDGITDAVSNQEIERVVRASKDSKETIAQQLMQMAKEKNDDDKSVIVLEIEDTIGSAVPAEKPAAAAAAAAPAAKKAQPEEKIQPAAEPAQAEPEGGETTAEEPEQETQDDDEEMTILDKIFGNPKLILSILGVVVVLVLMIILFSTLAKGCKKKEGDNSSKPVTSVAESVMESKADESVAEVSRATETSAVIQESSAAAEQSAAASQVEESSAAESSQAEESQAETSQAEESTAAPVGTTYTVEDGDTYYSILIDYYDDFSEELLEAFCDYNNVDSDMLYTGQVLQIPPISELQ
ncbi:MAG: SpoIIE family protein phosphatase [Firmicutes bacterium]|nr:SpoIIE family protein phosphatase [Bacillota bacterium]